MTPEQLVAHWRSEAARFKEKADFNMNSSLTTVARWRSYSLTLLACADELEQSLKVK
jgi:hypothetical protein